MSENGLSDSDLQWLWDQYFDYQRKIPTDRVVREYECIISALRELKERRKADTDIMDERFY